MLENIDRELELYFLRKLRMEEGELDTPCLVWSDNINRDGYGACNIKGRVSMAHRAVYALYMGPIQKGLLIRHICNNPSCCNINHLIPGTDQDNADDKVKAGRQSAKLTGQQASEIKWLCWNIGMSQIDIAAKYNISRSAIRSINIGMAWSHVEPIKPTWWNQRKKRRI
jgi:hypothetical protein